MTPDPAHQAAALRSHANIKRGAAALALECGDDQQAVSLHMQALADEAQADELAKHDTTPVE